MNAETIVAAAARATAYTLGTALAQSDAVPLDDVFERRPAGLLNQIARIKVSGPCAKGERRRPKPTAIQA